MAAEFPLRVVGGDLSLSSTGVAIASGEVTTIDPGKLRGEERLVHIRDLFRSMCLGADLAVLEGYSFAQRFSHSHALGELGGVVKVALHEAHIPFVIVPPAVLKVFACGKGNAPKDQVLVQAVKRSGIGFAGNDEADAWWLRAMGLAAYGFTVVKMPEANLVAVRKMVWPEFAVGATP